MANGNVVLRSTVYFIFFFTVTESAVLRFVAEPQSVTVKVGGSVELACHVEPREGSGVRWRLNGSPLTSDLTRGIIVKATGQLLVTNMTSSIAGSYDCVANDSRGAVISQPADVRIAEQWGFRGGLRDVQINVTEGNVALIPCSPSHGIPPPTVSFEHNGQTLNSSTGRHFVLPSGNLQIQGVRASDQGVYRCVAVNPVSGQRVLADNAAQLRVASSTGRMATRLVHKPEDKVEVILGQQLVLECVVDGWPVPTVTWYKHSGHLPEERFQQNLGNLFINNVNTFDQGNYICRADNGSPPHQAAVTVVDVLEPPNVRLSSGSVQRVIEGSTAHLECQAHGKPRVYVKWLHNGEDVALDATIISTDQTLTIDVVQTQHSGYYQCVATNRLGVAYATALLEVMAKNRRPQVKDTEPTELPPLQRDRRPSQGRSKTNSQSAAVAEEDFAMSDMSAGDSIANSEPGMFVEEEEPASVDFFETSTDEQRPRKKPSDDNNKVMTPPTRPEVTQRSKSSALVRWTVPDNNGLRITFFRIQYKDARSTGGRWLTMELDILPTIREYEVTGLEPGATYRFRVVAVYSNQDNRPSEVSARFTLDSADNGMDVLPPDGFPLIVEVKALSVDSLAIRWQYTSSGLMPVEGFYVYYKLYSFPGNYQSETVMGSHLRYHILRGLQPGAEYSLRMQCFNVAGTGDYSNTVVRRTSASHEVNDDGTVVVDEFHPEDRWSVPRHVAPALATPPTHSGDRAPLEGSLQGSDTLYLVLGVALGVMVIVLLIFVVMCGMRQAHHRSRMAAAANGKAIPLAQQQVEVVEQEQQMMHKKPQMDCASQAGSGASSNSNGQLTLNNGWLMAAGTPDGSNGSVRMAVSVNPMFDRHNNAKLRSVDSKGYHVCNAMQTIQSMADQPPQPGGQLGAVNSPPPPPLPPLPYPRPKPGSGHAFPVTLVQGFTSSSSAQSRELDPVYCDGGAEVACQLQPHHKSAFTSFQPRILYNGCEGPQHLAHGHGHDLAHVSGGECSENIYSGSTCGDGCEPLSEGDYLCLCTDCQQQCPDCSYPLAIQADHGYATSGADSYYAPRSDLASIGGSSRSSAGGGHNSAALVLQNIDNATREQRCARSVQVQDSNSPLVRPGFHPVGKCLVAPYKSGHSQHHCPL